MGSLVIIAGLLTLLASGLGLTGGWRLIFLPFTIRPGRMTVARLRLEIGDRRDVERVNSILRSFITTFNRAIASPSAKSWLDYGDALPALYRPFAHEGGAMGYTLRHLFFYRADQFEQTVVRPRPEFRYLYYVGLGFWSGVRKHNPARLEAITARLDPLHRFLCYDGYGFARTFFESRTNPNVAAALDILPGYARNAAYQGVGRALYFLHMGNPTRLAGQVDRLGPHAVDAAAGVGLAAVFVNPDRFEMVERVAAAFPPPLQPHFHLGMCFGLKARSINDLDQFERDLGRLPPSRQNAVWASIRECDRVELLVRADGAGDGYRRWRERVTQWLAGHVEYPMAGVVSEGPATAAAKTPVISAAPSG